MFPTDLSDEVLPFLHSDPGRFADDDDAFRVRRVQNFLGVRIMRSAEAIAAQPLEQAEIPRHDDRIVTFPPKIRILVLTETSGLRVGYRRLGHRFGWSVPLSTSNIFFRLIYIAF